MACQKVEIVRGTTNTFHITVYDYTGMPYTLGDGESVVFGIKKNPEQETTPIFTKVAESIGEGVFSVKLCPEDTTALRCGKYYYDAGLDDGTDFYNIIEPSPFWLVANVTHRGCAN